jgi:uncharacterized membrane protein
MEELLQIIANHVALAAETIAVLIAAFGVLHAVVVTVATLLGGQRGAHWGRDVWATFGSWLLGSLQFALAADIVRTTIAPTWEQIGELAAIAAIRTFLSIFLERDLAEARRQSAEDERGVRATTAERSAQSTITTQQGE